MKDFKQVSNVYGCNAWSFYTCVISSTADEYISHSIYRRLLTKPILTCHRHVFTLATASPSQVSERLWFTTMTTPRNSQTATNRNMNDTVIELNILALLVTVNTLNIND